MSMKWKNALFMSSKSILPDLGNRHNHPLVAQTRYLRIVQHYLALPLKI